MTEQSKPAFDVCSAAGERAWKSSDQEQLWRALTRHACSSPIRYNLCGVHVRDGSAFATDGHRLLVVNGIAKGTANATYAVENGRLTLEILDGKFPDTYEVFSDSVMSVVPKRFTLSNFSKLRKLSADTPLRLTSDGLLIGSGPADCVAVNLRFLSQLPFTDEVLTIDVREKTSPIIVRPNLGGWLAVLMPVRIEAKDSFLREVHNG